MPAGPRAVVHVVRHGLVHNPRGILYGRLPDYHLSDVGTAMAERVATHLKATVGGKVTYLAASPLERAAETAIPISRELGLDVVTDVRLIEPANVFEGSKFAVGDGVLKRPANWRKVLDPFTPSWGEAYLSIARRMMAAAYAAAQAATDGARSADGSGEGDRHAVLVSHQLPIWTLRRFLEGRRLWHNPAKRQCGLASITTITFTGGVVTAIDYAEPAADLVPTSTAGATGA
ncbi:MAG: histidine phosphatase family protein [Nakamurella sp.]